MDSGFRQNDAEEEIFRNGTNPTLLLFSVKLCVLCVSVVNAFALKNLISAFADDFVAVVEEEYPGENRVVG